MAGAKKIRVVKVYTFTRCLSVVVYVGVWRGRRSKTIGRGVVTTKQTYQPGQLVQHLTIQSEMGGRH